MREFIGPRSIATALGAACIALALILAVGAYLQWRRAQRAIRRGAPLPRPVLVPIVVAGIGVVAALAGVTALLQ